MLNQSPSLFFKEIFTASSEVRHEMSKLKEMMPEGGWDKSELVNSKYDNYILVIGESARRDYHHAYGYPINNTPFMSSSNGLLVDGLTSGGTNTIASLRLMLTVPDKQKWEPDYSHNFIDMVKSANLKTYWISNQGFLGPYDTPVSAIARRSEKKIFLKYGAYDSKNTSDFALIDKFRHVLQTKPHEKKLIVIHLYGSHPNACDRILDYNAISDISDVRYSNLNCYISSIKKTDDLLKKIYNILSNEFAAKGASFSMLYFSDHGLAHNEIESIIYMNNGKVSKFHFDIPLFMVSSDSDKRIECKSFKSGLNFTNGIANWIGIHNESISSDYSLFDCTDDPDDYGLQNQINNTDLKDPAIDLTGK
ncbi:phosphoethanolamine transferase [Salmonella enterica]|nr:phosphoethanolamine transferase [Salmonella enterica]